MTTTFDRVLTDVFDRGAEARLSLDDEREAITAAKTGDEAATTALIYAYAPALRSLAARYREALGDEDARATAIVGLLDAVALYDPERGERLAGLVADRVTHALGDAAAADLTFSIPPRSLQRFYGILRRAGGDAEKARDLAPSFDMSREAFSAIFTTLRHTERLDATEGVSPASPLWTDEPGFADAEDRVLVDKAFRSVGDVEREVCRLAYGFADYDPVPDAEIGHRLGYTRPTVQRIRARALGKMRDVIGL